MTPHTPTTRPPPCLRAKYRPEVQPPPPPALSPHISRAPYRASALEAWAALVVAPVVVGALVLAAVTVAGLVAWWEG